MKKFFHQRRVHAHDRANRHSPADIQHQGREAFLAECTQADNPYPSNTADARAWESGFLIEFQKFYFSHRNAV